MGGRLLLEPRHAVEASGTMCHANAVQVIIERIVVVAMIVSVVITVIIRIVIAATRVNLQPNFQSI